MSQGDLGERLVDSINATHGVHAGHRAAHAKGVLCAAQFAPDRAASALSRAAYLDVANDPVRAHVRFSNGGGNPATPDGRRDGRGMAVKWYLPDGSTADLVAVTLPAFFARTPEDLLVFNDARRPDPATGAPDPDRVAAYVDAHPEVLTAAAAAMSMPIPSSYATLSYNALHAFWLVDADGARRAARFHWVPEAAGRDLEDDEAEAADPDYLGHELRERLAAGPVVFSLEASLAAPGDPVDDPTAVWPDDRERVTLGTLTVTGVATDRERDGDVLVFDPSRVPDGIECSDDPILAARSGAYRVSVARRTGT